MEEPNKLEQQPSVEVVKQPQVQNKEIITEGVTPVSDMGGGYVEYDSKLFQKDALKELRPDLFSVRADVGAQSSTNFGSNFPKISKKGEIFVRVDVLPNRVYKFDGRRWIEVNKAVSNTYLTDQNYLNFLIEKVGNGEYDLDTLTDVEKEFVLEHLNNQKT